ncbi:MAG: AAA family ATPase [Gemmatimonadetes bacterium]|nr:AAA family ATPase [Gemmatimonadota bacterium]
MTEPASPSLSDQPAAGAATPSRTSGLPRPLTSFVGRDDEIEAITVLLTSGAVRLVTLTGPGGAGKTRLAIQVASRMTNDAYPDGIRFVSLSVTREAASVEAVIARALGIQQQRASARDAIVEELGSGPAHSRQFRAGSGGCAAGRRDPGVLPEHHCARNEQSDPRNRG